MVIGNQVLQRLRLNFTNKYGHARLHWILTENLMNIFSVGYSLPHQVLMFRFLFMLLPQPVLMRKDVGKLLCYIREPLPLIMQVQVHQHQITAVQI